MTKKIIRCLGFLSIIVALSGGCVPRQEVIRQEVINNYYYAAPVLLPGTASEMNTAGFWIGAHPDPDRIIIPAKDVEAFNKSIRKETGTVLDLSYYPGTVKGSGISGSLKGTLKFVSSKKYFQQDGRKADSSFFGPIEEQMAVAKIPAQVSVRFGFVTSYTPQRLLPTNTQLYSSMKNIDIDRLQNSALDIGTPVAVLHGTRDGRWLYVVAPLCEGWINAAHVGFCSKEQMTSCLESETFVITTDSKVDLFLDPALRVHHAYLRMGCRFPAVKSQNPDAAGILVPFRGKDGSCEFKETYAASSDVSSQYLPYTPRTIIRQAFKLLNSPYGWGDMHGEQDCSRFIQQIFATVGVQLPRNSLQQARVGRLIARFNGSSSDENRLVALSDNSIGGISILHMAGHIMLFLGNVDGNPYAIHDMLAYSEPAPDGERLMIVNRVVVSNLRIGDGTKSGTFLRRLVTVRAFEKKPT